MKKMTPRKITGSLAVPLFRVWHIVLCALLLLSACAVGPDYQRPPQEVPGSWIDASGRAGQEHRAEAVQASLASWWQALNDPVLISLIERGIGSNLDLKLAAQRVRQSRAVLGQTRAGLLPSLDASASYQRSGTHVPDESGEETDTVTAVRSDTRNLYHSGFDASWELDVFGGTRRSVEAASADVQASVEDLRDTLVILTGEIGIRYLDLRTFQEQLRIARENLQTQERSAAITRKRYQAGFSSALDVSNAEAQAAATRAQIPVLESQIRQAIYQLGLLTGNVPGALIGELTPERPVPLIPADIPAGLPSELLQRRPDIRAAESRLHAATARIGAAKADLFPRFFLTGSGTLQAANLESWSESVTRLWSFGPSVRWNIFSGGSTRSRIEENRARAEQALLEYRRTILVALQEVESAWVAYEKETERAASLEVAVDRSKRAVELANRLYVEGQSDFLSVLIAERSLLSAQQALAQSRSQAMAYLVSLYKALGGGWDTAATG